MTLKDAKLFGLGVWLALAVDDVELSNIYIKTVYALLDLIFNRQQ